MFNSGRQTEPNVETDRSPGKPKENTLQIRLVDSGRGRRVGMLLCFQEASGLWMIRQQSQGLLGTLAAPSGTLLAAHMMSNIWSFQNLTCLFSVDLLNSNTYVI